MEIFINYMLNKAKKIAEQNFIECNGDTDIGFYFEGKWIINPWMDPTGRFELSFESAKETYGVENIRNFILLANEEQEKF